MAPGCASECGYKPEEVIHRCSLNYVSLKTLKIIITRKHLC